MGLRSRRKGKVFERAVAAMLRAVGFEAKRGFQSRGGGREEPDVVVEGLPVHMECKCGARPNVWAAWEQANSDAAPGTVPVVVMHRDQAKPGEGATELMVVGLSEGVRMLAHLHRTGYFATQAPGGPVAPLEAHAAGVACVGPEAAASGHARACNGGVR